MTKPKTKTETTEAPASDTPQQGFDAFTTVIDNDGDPRAPRLTVGWEAIQAVLADGKVHPLADLTAAVTDLTESSVRQLLNSAINAGKVETIYDGRQERKTGRPARKYRAAK